MARHVGRIQRQGGRPCQHCAFTRWASWWSTIERAVGAQQGGGAGMRACIVTFRVLVMVLAYGMAGGATAQQSDHHHPQHGQAPNASDGEIKAIDRKSSKVTIEQRQLTQKGSIATTLHFPVIVPSLLDKVQKGDKVRFTVKKVHGQLTITALDLID